MTDKKIAVLFASTSDGKIYNFLNRYIRERTVFLQEKQKQFPIAPEINNYCHGGLEELHCIDMILKKLREWDGEKKTPNW